MKFKGMNFRIAKNVVILPAKNFKGRKYSISYIRFGKIIPQGGKIEGNDHFIPFRTWENGSPVWAKEIEVEYWSLTNMMSGKDGRLYLAYEGSCYTCKSN